MRGARRRDPREARREDRTGDARDGEGAPFSVKGNVLRIERRAVDMLIRTMNAIVQSLYPTASVEVFGSFPTASWVPGASNLDIALSLPEA